MKDGNKLIKTTAGLGGVDKLLKLAEKAPPAQRSPLGPFTAVVLTLRNKGYSYEKIADFLTKHTRQEFTRSQVFSFAKRNSAVFGMVNRQVEEEEEEEGEPVPSQRLFDHVQAVINAAAPGIPFDMRIQGAVDIKDPSAPPEVEGLVEGRRYFNYRIRKNVDTLLPEWWDGKQWAFITESAVKYVKLAAVNRNLGMRKEYDWQA